MKFTWGTGILLVIIIFLIAIISFVFFSRTQKVNLVEEDYYPKELNFDTQIEKQSNTEALTEKIRFTVSDSVIVVDFPAFVEEEMVEGTIQVYRPSDFEEDLLYTIELDSGGMQYIPTEGLLPGRYIIKVDWSFDGKEYYQEKAIIN